MFGYLRIFSVLSLLAVMVIAVSAGIYFRNVATENFTQLVEKNNNSLASGYLNTVWKRYHGFIVPLSANPEQLRANPDVAVFAQETVGYFQQMPLVRVNLYSPAGVLLLSDNVNPANTLQGGTTSPDAAFVTAHMKAMAPSSQLLPNLRLQNMPRAKLLQTIVPMHIVDAGGNNNGEGALELLYDVTDPLAHVVDLQSGITGGIIGLFLVFLLLMSLTSKRAENIIARQHEANLELAETAAAAQAENQEKSQFLANISHELRTPLNAIIGFSNIIKIEVLPQVQERKYDEYINDIHASGVHLLSLINDILDYSKAEAGKLELEVGEISATKMIQNSMRLVSPRAETGQVQLVENLPKDPLIMLVDSKKFKQVLLNLLSNAVKFTQPGGKVTVSAWENIVDSTLSFEVHDTGIGIAPKDISRAMSPFGQIDNTLKRKYEGTGLGLPLTKKFVELMGGKFTIESEPNKGTTITFTLPRQMKARPGVVVKQAS